mgnify:CR=1 FL=1
MLKNKPFVVRGTIRRGVITCEDTEQEFKVDNLFVPSSASYTGFFQLRKDSISHEVLRIVKT